jgi:hypothetical protein
MTNQRSKPERKLISLPLTDAQHEALKPLIGTRWGPYEGAIFMVMTRSYEPSVGRPVANMVCACLPPEDAKKVVNTIRKFFGLPTFKLRGKKRERVEKTSTHDSRTNATQRN